jgi:hypothetical protein
MISTLLVAITRALEAYIVYVQLQRETRIDQIEDEIDRVAAIGDAASKLRTRRLLLRKKRLVEQLGSLRSSTDSSD